MTQCIFGVEFLKFIVIFGFSAHDFFKLQNLVQKQKALKLAPKIPKLGILGL